MKRAFFPFLCVLIALLQSVTTGHGQEKTSKVEEHGWGSSWTTPATEQQRQLQQFVGRCDALEKTKNFQGIIAACDDELRKQPDSILVYVVRATAQASLKNYDQALSDLNHARDLATRKNRPTTMCSVLTFRAKVEVRRKDYRAAIDDLHAALKINRAEPHALNELAWILATAPDAGVRNGREAVSLAKKALAATPSAQTYAVTDTLAVAYAESNQCPRAVEFGKRALEQARQEVKDATKLAKFQQEATDRLHLFEQGQSYHPDVQP